MNNKKILTFGYLFYTLVFLVHLLTLAKVIPYDWINGGRSDSYEAQAQVSLVSMVILSLGILFLYLSRKKEIVTSKAYQIISWLFVPFWALSSLLQVLGTTFERFIMLPIALFGTFIHLKLARKKAS